MDKKALKNKYKLRKITGGIYRLRNRRNGMYLVDYATDLQAIQNRFEFQVSLDSCFHYKLKKDWQAFGGKVFIFEILEMHDKKREQSLDEFIDDLKILKQLWSEKLDASSKY